MVQLVETDIKTREVLDWKGVHVLHFIGSSCSQKLRVFLNLKGIPWESHPIDLPGNENFKPWFLGINPRGLVPVLVDDGAVHIESNDIIAHLEQKFPVPRLIPAGHENEIAALLKHEDDDFIKKLAKSNTLQVSPTLTWAGTPTITFDTAGAAAALQQIPCSKKF